MSYICFDIGGTNIKYGLLDINGHIIEKDIVKTCLDKEGFIKQLDLIITKYLSSNKINGIAFSMPGFIDYKNGIALKAGALTNLDGFNFIEYFSNKYQVNVSIENDANCIVLAEKWLGYAKDLRNFLCLSIGTGIGGGTFINNQLYRGANFAASEFGYMIVNGTSNNLPGYCNMSSTSSIYALRRIYAKYYNLAINDVSGFDVFNSEDVFIKKSINDFYYNMAILITNLHYTFNPEVILIGGAISSNPDLINILEDNIKMLYLDTHYNFKIAPCLLENDAGLVGALAHFISINR